MAWPDETIEVMFIAKTFKIIASDSWNLLRIMFETIQNSREATKL